MDKLDLSGQRFGKLVVLREAPKGQDGRRSWECLCDCGKTTIVKTYSLTTGNTQSCGCLRSESEIESGRKRRKYQGTYKGQRPRLYNTWVNMIRRCHNPNFVDYPRWGGRGVFVCDEWIHDFQAFLTWAESNGWVEGLTLDRIDNDGPYSPENCRWASLEEQSNNKRNSRFLKYKGEVLTVAQWSRKLNIPCEVLYSRIYEGWSDEKVLSYPYKSKDLDLSKIRTLDEYV